MREARRWERLVLALSVHGFCEEGDDIEVIVEKVSQIASDYRRMEQALFQAGTVAQELGITRGGIDV